MDLTVTVEARSELAAMLFQGVVTLGLALLCFVLAALPADTHVVGVVWGLTGRRTG